MKDFKGIYPALMTPLTAAGELDSIALRRLVRVNLNKGVHGFYVCGSTAEVFLLKDSQRKEILETVLDEVGGKVPVIAQIGSISQVRAEALARHAARAGADAVSSVPPFYYPFSAREIQRYYFSLAETAGIPVLIYNIPSYSGVKLTVRELEPMLKDPRFLGVKHTSSDFFMLERMKAVRPEMVAYNGLDEMFLAGLSMGADGGIGSTYNFMAEKFIRMFELYRQGKMQEALHIQINVNRFIETLSSLGLMAAEKEVLCMQGICSNRCLEPFTPLSEEARGVLRRMAMECGCALEA